MTFPIPRETLEIGIGLLVLGLLWGSWFSGRARIAPRGHWPVAWAVLVAMGGMRVIGLPAHYELIPTVAFWALFVAGAYRYAERPTPGWLIPASLGVCGALTLAFLEPSFQIAGWLSVITAWAGAFVSATVVHRAAKSRNASMLHRLLPLGFIATVALGNFDHFVAKRGLDLVSIWLVGGILVAAHQAIAIFDVIRGRADAIARELEESVSTLRSTLEATDEGILVVDRDGRYTNYNRAFGEMWRIPEDVLAHRESDSTLAYSKDQLVDPDEFYRQVKRLYADPEAESFDTLEFKDGRTFERYSRPQRIGDEIVGRVWSFRDVTERRRAERILERNREQLEELVEERTQELVESRDQLRQADRMAAIGTLAAGVAHQINNPIGAILNAAEYALLCEDEDEAVSVFKDALRTNAEEARRCGAIVRGMLQFARQEPVPKVVEDLNEAVRQATRAVEGYATRHHGSIQLDISPTPIEFPMSLLEMEQVIVNLLRNAIEAAPPKPEVRVSTQLDGKTARIEVSDNGRGIEDKHRTEIFDPFFSTRIIEGGTGLGLSVAHGIVTDHGGQIAVTRSDERGTTFTIELPIE